MPAESPGLCAWLHVSLTAICCTAVFLASLGLPRRTFFQDSAGSTSVPLKEGDQSRVCTVSRPLFAHSHIIVVLWWLSAYVPVAVVKRKTTYLLKWSVDSSRWERLYRNHVVRAVKRNQSKREWWESAILKMMVRGKKNLTWADSEINGLRNSLYVSGE